MVQVLQQVNSGKHTINRSCNFSHLNTVFYCHCACCNTSTICCTKMFTTQHFYPQQCNCFISLPLQVPNPPSLTVAPLYESSGVLLEIESQATEGVSGCVIRESVDSLCRDGADAQYMQYLSKSHITSPQTRKKLI